MDTWEYYVISLLWDNQNHKWTVNVGNQIYQSAWEALNALGTDGWELVSIVAAQWDPSTTYSAISISLGEIGGAGGWVKQYSAYLKRRKP